MYIEYFLFIFFASLAVIQAASAWQNLKFILFLKNRTLSFALGLLVIISSYYWFFYGGGRDVRDTGGNKQLFLFPVAVLSSTVFTLLFSSLIHARKTRQEESKKEVPLAREGIEVLKEMTYWQAVRQILLLRKK